MDAPFTDHAKCRDEDPEVFFVAGAHQNDVKFLCRSCPVRTDCLAEALDGRVEFGVWGGMTERERRALLRRRTDVTDWKQLLAQARAAYERSALPQPRRTLPVHAA